MILKQSDDNFSPEDSIFLKPLSVLIIYFITTAIIYYSSRYAGFVTDLIGFEQTYDQCGFVHFYECTGLKNFRYLQHLFSYVLYITAGSDTIYWYLLYCIGHALAAFSGFLFFREIFNDRLKNGKWMAFIAAFLFLISPYQNEVVVWKVCIQYCTITICAMLSLYFYVLDSKHPQMRYPLLSLGLMIFGIFSLEQIVILPLLIFAVFLFLFWENKSQVNTKRVITHYLIPQLSIVGGFFLLSKLIYGKWIMHYGSKLFSSINPFELIGKNFSYTIKYLFFSRNWPHAWKYSLQDILASPIVATALATLSIFFLIYWITTYKSGNKKNGILALMMCLYFISMLPVLQLYMTILLKTEGDRIGYFSSIFIFGGIISAISGFSTRLRNTFIFFMLISNLFLAFNMDHLWAQSDKIYKSYMSSFNEYNARRVFILSTPDNYDGVLLFRIFGDSSGVKEALQYRYKKRYNGLMSEVMHFNQQDPYDGTKVEMKNDSTIRVSFKQFGNWFWHDGIGASSRENEMYNIELGDGFYDVHFKNFNPNTDVMIYADSSKFKKFDFIPNEKN